MELKHPDDALSSLLGARVVDLAGARIGRVRDVRAVRAPDGTLTIEALLVGRRASRVIPWADVQDLHEGIIRIGSGR